MNADVRTHLIGFSLVVILFLLFAIINYLNHRFKKNQNIDINHNDNDDVEQILDEKTEIAKLKEIKEREEKNDKSPL